MIVSVLLNLLTHSIPRHPPHKAIETVDNSLSSLEEYQECLL